MKRIVVGNWKLYIESPEEALWLARSVKRRVKGSSTEVVLCPPTALVADIKRAAAPVKVGGQDVSIHENGAHTGEISARLLKASGATHVLLGHSERRAMGETDTAIAEKFARAVAAKLIPILCVGEEVRDATGAHFGVIERQLRSGLAKVGKKAPQFIVAYEPVWAIGRKAEDAMKPMELQETVIFIRKIVAALFGRKEGLSIPVLYGGSVDAANAGDLVKEGGVQGLLVGRASIDPKEFSAIVDAF